MQKQNKIGKVNKHQLITAGIVFLFILLNGVLLQKDLPWGLFAPAAVAVVFLAFVSLDVLFIAIAALIPLSVPLRFLLPEVAFDLYLPTEPLIFGVMLLFWIRTLSEQGIHADFLRHPLTIVVIVHLIWMFVSALTSTMFLVSVKYFIARFWFVSTFFFFGFQVFQSEKRIRQFATAYLIPLALVVLYTLFQHSQTGLGDQQAAHSASYPFFNDHTSYGAMLVFFLPPLLALIRLRTRERKWVLLHWLLLGILITGLLFSYTRAAWLSLFGGLAIFLCLLFRIRLSYILLIGLLAVMLVVSSWSRIVMKLEENQQDSSGDLAEHVQSMSNISSDASNLERINRWKCALRMFREKPVTGWGPGTYQFQYAPFQMSYDRTIISTNFGDVGNAHSEYLGPLAEGGVPALLLMLALLVYSLITGFRVVLGKISFSGRVLSLAALTSLITYFLHGFLNNFLDTDKASGPFWAFLAVLVVYDLQRKAEKKASEEFDRHD